jgi:hypothetical protein
MKLEKLRSLLTEYKREFPRIYKDEIYKWQAVKTFQENWDINASDFHAMLEKSLSRTINLLNARNYFPLAVILVYAKSRPELLRGVFSELYDEEVSLDDRIKVFKESIARINKDLEPQLKNYQDHHAISVYLSLRYPDRYYIYKFSLYTKFINLIEDNTPVIKGDDMNIPKYNFLCDVINGEIKRDRTLIDMHRERITESEYFDNEYHILTQDFIHASVTYLQLNKSIQQKPVLQRLIKSSYAISPKLEFPVLKGKFINHEQNDREKKRIGDLGEILVLEYEKARLKELNINKVPIHESKCNGDGLGYDILSYNDSGENIFIEVKTTKNSADQPFYITQNELECSKINDSHYYLYRLYDYNDRKDEAEFFIHTGNLCDLCINPVQYRVVLS